MNIVDNEIHTDNGLVMNNENKFDMIKNYTTTAVFLAMVFIGFISIVIGKGKEILGTIGIIDNSDIYNQSVYIDWTKEYPFSTDAVSEEENVVYSQSALDKVNGILELYKTKVHNAEYMLEQSTDYIVGYNNFLEINGYINRVIDKKDFVQQNELVCLDDGRIISLQKETPQENMDKIVESVSSLSEYSESLGIKFVYVGLPAKFGIDEELPADIKSYDNENLSTFLNRISGEGVECFDLRDIIADRGLDVGDMFYKTDHHWKIETGLWSAKTIAEHMNTLYSYNMNVDLLDINNYASKDYKESWVGSMGRTLTLGYCDLEDFNILYPSFEHNLKVSYPDLDLELEGSFLDTMINWKRFDNIEDIYNNNLYEAFTYGCRPVTKIDNTLNEDGVKILTINDSYTLTMAPYLSLAADEVHMIDDRGYNGNFFGSVRAYIEEYQPDVVLLTYMPEVEFLDRLR